MPMDVTYITVGGVIMMEVRDGVETAYVHDTQGSVIECRDAAGTKTYEAWYWPYGEVRTSTGTNPSPWGFCGGLGYYTDKAVGLYVRARNLRTDLMRWTTVDPLWPDEPAYRYPFAPQQFVDPSGTIGICAPPDDCSEYFKFDDLLPETRSALEKCFRSGRGVKDVAKCLRGLLGKKGVKKLLLDDKFAAFVACRIGAQMSNPNEPNHNPCSQYGGNAEACCGGKHAVCQWKCYAKDHGLDPLGIGMAHCLEKCRLEAHLCVLKQEGGVK